MRRAARADRSCGIHAAKLGGLPAAIVARAEEILVTLEAGAEALGEVHPDELTPKEALGLLYRLKGMVGKG